MHKLLARQLRRAFGTEQALPDGLAPFLAMVDATYVQSDVDREMLERSLDLSSQELSERSRRAEAKSMGLLRALPDFVLYLGADDTVLDVRAPWPEALTCEARQAIGHPVHDIVAPDGALGEWMADALQAAREAGTVQVVEFRDTWQPGARRDLELRVSPLDRGEALAVVRDISERKTAERALQESQERLELAILGSADGLWDWDPRTGRILISPRFREMLGASIEELPDRIEAIDARLHPDDRARTWNAVGAHFQEQVPFDETCRALHRDGEYRWFQLRGQAIWDELGEPTRMAGSIRDISDLKAKERELERARDAAEAASRAKDEFLANMSHEIRTPMNAVLGLTQLLLEGELRPRERGYATSMLDAGRSLLSLINDLLDISRIETGVLTLDPMEFSLPTTVTETFHLFEPKASAKGLAISMTIDEQSPDRVVGDPGRLRQILMCLLDNAVKFTPQGAIALSVTVAPDDEVRFAVQDTGIGIPEDRMADILEKFTQVDGASTRRHGGTGIGLAISRHLAQLMGGRIEVESTLGAGSRFTLSVPLARATAPAVVLEPVATPALSGVRVLVLNDDPESSQRLQEDFESLGMTVTSVATPAEALGALRAGARGGDPYGVCVVNDRSSDLQSEAMARVIKRDPLLADTVLAILVTLGMPGDARRLFDVGFTAYLAPPLHPEDVRDAVASAWRLERVVGARSLITRHSLAEARTQRAPQDRTPGREVAELAVGSSSQQEGARPSHEAPRGSEEAPLVLVVDDNDINRHVANEMLRRIGCRVLLADGGEAGVRLAAEHPFDLILMDVQMPVVDGFEAAARIRQQQAAGTRRTPIVAVTANAMRGDRQRCLDGGMDDYLAKPVTRAGLYELVQRWVPRAVVVPTPVRRTGGTPGAVRAQGAMNGAPPPAAVAPSTPPVDPTAAIPESALDVRQLRSIVGDDPARVAEFLAMFVSLTTPMVDALVQAVTAGDATEVRRQAHKLKGSCGSAGAKELAALGARAERLAQDEDWGALRGSMGELRHALDRVKGAITVAT